MPEGNLKLGDTIHPVYVTYGVRDGTFHSKKLVPTEKGDGLIDPEPLILSGELIFAANVNRDAVVDLLMPGVILLSTTDPPDPNCQAPLGWKCAQRCTLFQCSRLDTWVEVRDFTGDTLPDLVVPTSNSRDLAFWMGTTDELFTAFELPTLGVTAGNSEPSAAALQSASADFDGDQIPDFAFPERLSGDSSNASATIFFGEAFAPPEQSFSTGTLGNVLEIAATPVLSATGLTAALGALVHDGKTTRASVHIGQARRSPVSPIIVPSEREDKTLQVLAAKIRAGERKDLVVITDTKIPQTSRGLITVPSEASGYALPSLSDARLPFPSDFQLGYFQSFVLDLDGDATDEIVFWGSSENMQQVRVLVARATNGTWSFEPVRTIADGTSDRESDRKPLVMQNIDIDRDGRSDVYGMAVVEGKPSLVIYRSSVSTPLSAESLLSLKAPSVSFAYSFLNMGTDAALEFVMFSKDQINIYDLDFEGRELRIKEQLEGPSDVKSVRSSDFDGDGIFDLAFVSKRRDAPTDNVEILWGEPVR